MAASLNPTTYPSELFLLVQRFGQNPSQTIKIGPIPRSEAEHLRFKMYNLRAAMEHSIIQARKGRTHPTHTKEDLDNWLKLLKVWDLMILRIFKESGDDVLLCLQERATSRVGKEGHALDAVTQALLATAPPKEPSSSKKVIRTNEQLAGELHSLLSDDDGDTDGDME